MAVQGLSGSILFKNSKPVSTDGLSGSVLFYNQGFIGTLSGSINLYDAPLYAPVLQGLSRTPLDLVNVILDYCDNEFGVSPCTATGEACYNTYPTCKDVTNFSKTSKTYQFSSLEAPYKGVRPYVKSIKWLPTEIKPGKLTVKGRVTVTFADEPDTDRGVDPYVDSRASVQGTFWKKLLARNPNFKGRTVEIHKGFDAIPVDDFELRWAGQIETIKLGNNTVTVEVVDELAALDKIEIPPKLDLDLQADVSAAVTSLTLSTSDGVPTSGYIRIDDEAISYTALNTTTNVISGCTRGALGTTAATHTSGTKVDLCVFFEPTNPFDIMEGMLTNALDITTDNPPGAGIAAARVDSAAFAAAKAFPGDEPRFSSLIYKPTKLSKLLFEIADICDCSLWVNEAQKITLRRNNVSNQGGRTYTELTDDNAIISASADLNEESRKTRVVIYWDRSIWGDSEEVSDYNAINIAVDSEAESANEYNGVEEKKIFSRWLRKAWSAYETDGTMARYVSNLSSRLLANYVEAQPIVNMKVELKDEGLQAGDYVELTTDELQTVTGEDFTGVKFVLFKRDPKTNTLNLSAVRIRETRVALIAPDTTPDYPSATAADKEYGFICNDSGTMADGSEPYRIY